ncbi:MAG: arylsulfatase [Bryobacterales bacterium]|nr:arylsulfatase [Bryobacterales bacterium]
MPSSSPLSRRQWLNSLSLGLASASAARPQQGCAVTPANTFAGVIGRTAADSKPAPLDAGNARSGSPNILYILLDDTGFSDLHCFGSEAATPNIDALAAAGLLYNNFHSKAICSPTRASLLTGRNSHAVGMKELAGADQGYPHSRGRVTPAAATAAQILGAHGYSTYGVGKWHLVPAADMKASGSRAHWPLQKGFDRWYGFLSGWTDQYKPDLFEDNHTIPRPNRPDYHFSVDIVDKSIGMMDQHLTADPGKPFFLYVAFGATHAPIQVPKTYTEKYVSTFQRGWDQIRQERHQRQLALGVIPPGTKLPPRNPGDPAWADLSAEEQAVHTRFMAAYAGFLEHTDEQIGRLVAYLKEHKLFDNTAIFLMSDNGGAPEAGVKGGFARPYGDPTTIHQMHERLDEMGTPTTQPLYARPWAYASNTPFPFYKLWPYAGGVQTPFVFSWPSGIRQTGLRQQFVDVIDITPTALDIAGIEAPAVFHGVCQMPMQGKSIRPTFNDAKSPDPRDRQYYELWGSRGIWHDGWKAVGIHTPGTSFDNDRWELYHVAVDFSESQKLAAQHPEKLEELKRLWWAEAEKNGALPLLEAPGGRRATYDQALPPSARTAPRR